VMAVDFREGNRDRFEGQLDFNITGFGGLGEGPIAGGKGSWMASARRSYFDLIAKLVDIGSTAPPNWGDVQGKAVVDLSPSHRLSFIGITADDHNAPDRDAAIAGDMLYYGSQDTRESSAGIGWRGLWGSLGFSNVTVGWNSTRYSEKWDETGSGLPVIRNRSIEESIRLRGRNRLILGPSLSVEFGAEAAHLSDRYRMGFGAFTDALGAASDSALVHGTFAGWKLGAFASVEVSPHPLLTLNAGGRWDRFTFNGSSTFSPRLSASWRVTDRTTLSGAAGLYHQTLPMVLMSQNTLNQELADPSAQNVVLGVSRMLGESAKASVEVYRKTYRHFPLDPGQPSLFLLDEQEYRYTYFTSHGPLTDTGKALSQGVEILVQKKMAHNFYGLIGASWFRTRYRDGTGTWRNRVLDVRYLLSAEGGYKPDRNWEFSGRWIVEGGAPYTPFDAEASAALGRGVMDASRINGARLPAYHSLNLRFDRRFSFRNSNLIAYLCVWNAYNHKNVQTVFWNTVTNQQGKIYQWSLMPILGMEYEF
ncbi:TonB-dependent receptor, partial [bacterium]|nr:TonB-dependent receptor [bacterium]